MIIKKYVLLGICCSFVLSTFAGKKKKADEGILQEGVFARALAEHNAGIKPRVPGENESPRPRNPYMKTPNLASAVSEVPLSPRSEAEIRQEEGFVNSAQSLNAIRKSSSSDASVTLQGSAASENVPTILDQTEDTTTSRKMEHDGDVASEEENTEERRPVDFSEGDLLAPRTQHKRIDATAFKVGIPVVIIGVSGACVYYYNKLRNHRPIIFKKKQ